jgi:hypothetical protein
VTVRVILALFAASIIAAGAWLWRRSGPERAVTTSTAAAAAAQRPAPSLRTPVGPAPAPPAPPPGAPSAINVPTGTSHPATPEEAEARRIRHIETIVRNLRRDYVDLGEVAGLTEVERDTVLLLIASYRVDDMEIELANAADGLAGVHERDLREKQRRADLVGLLGAERAARVLAFERTVPVRMETRLVADSLADTPWPMTPEQSRRLTAAAIAAMERQAPSAVARSGAENRDAVQQEDLARFDQTNATLLQVARGVLNAEQFAYYESFMQAREIYRGDVID